MSVHTMADEAYEKRLEAENARLKAALSAATKRAEDEGKRAHDLESWIMAVAHVTENEEWNKVCTRANDIVDRLTAAEQALSAATKRAEGAERRAERDDKAMTVAYDAMNAERKAAEHRAATAEALIKALASSVAGLVQIGIDREQVTTLAQHQLSEALAREAGLREALEYIAEEHDAGRHDGLPEACPANGDVEMWSVARRALSTPTPHPWGEVVRAAQEETQAEIDEPTLSRTRRSGEAARIVWKARQKRRAAVSALLTSAYPSDTAALPEGADNISHYWPALDKEINAALIEAGRLAVEETRAEEGGISFKDWTNPPSQLDKAREARRKACAPIIEKEKP